MAKEKFDFIQPFKDIPRTLKGFPKNLVHIWKDPVNNSKEVADRKKEIFPYIYLFAGLFLVFLILYVVIPSQTVQSVMMVLAIIPGFGVLGGIFLLNVMKKALEKFTDLECPNCKAQIKYSPDVQTRVLNKQFSVSTKKDYMSGVNRNQVTLNSPMYCDANGKETTTVEVTCKCQACGTEKTFTHAFVTAECTVHAQNIPAISIDSTLRDLEKSVREEGAEGFEEKGTGTTARGVNIKYNRSVTSLVQGYFGNEIQMR